MALRSELLHQMELQRQELAVLANSRHVALSAVDTCIRKKILSIELGFDLNAKQA